MMTDLEAQKEYLRQKHTPERFNQAVKDCKGSTTLALLHILSEDIKDPNCSEYIEYIFKKNAKEARARADRGEFDLSLSDIKESDKIWRTPLGLGYR